MCLSLFSFASDEYVLLKNLVNLEERKGRERHFSKIAVTSWGEDGSVIKASFHIINSEAKSATLEN